jgi:hypothetical protein
MTFRIGALLCLSGLAACSNTNSEPAQAPSSYETSTASAEPATDRDLTPASLEPRSSATNASAVNTDAAGTRAPLGTDTARANEARANEARANEVRDDGRPAAASDPPRAATTPGTQPDNTKVNERDRKDAALTPMDQGNNETDLKITQQIRQAVMADGSLSFTAKNVKIITNGGKVTLRGPVKTEQERNAIDAAARKVTAQVDNQIEVKK